MGRMPASPPRIRGLHHPTCVVFRPAGFHQRRGCNLRPAPGAVGHIRLPGKTIERRVWLGKKRCRSTRPVTWSTTFHPARLPVGDPRWFPGYLDHQRLAGRVQHFSAGIPEGPSLPHSSEVTVGKIGFFSSTTPSQSRKGPAYTTGADSAARGRNPAARHTGSCGGWATSHNPGRRPPAVATL